MQTRARRSSSPRTSTRTRSFDLKASDTMRHASGVMVPAGFVTRITTEPIRCRASRSSGSSCRFVLKSTRHTSGERPRATRSSVQKSPTVTTGLARPIAGRMASPCTSEPIGQRRYSRNESGRRNVASANSANAKGELPIDMDAHLLRDLGPRVVHDDHVALPILRCLVPAQRALVLVRDRGAVLARLWNLDDHTSPFLPGAAFRSRAVLFDPVEFAEGGLAHRESDLRLPRRPFVRETATIRVRTLSPMRRSRFVSFPMSRCPSSSTSTRSSMTCEMCRRPSRGPNRTKAPNLRISTTVPSTISWRAGANTRASYFTSWYTAPSPWTMRPSPIRSMLLAISVSVLSAPILPSRVVRVSSRATASMSSPRRARGMRWPSARWTRWYMKTGAARTGSIYLSLYVGAPEAHDSSGELCDPRANRNQIPPSCVRGLRLHSYGHSGLPKLHWEFAIAAAAFQAPSQGQRRPRAPERHSERE